MDPTLLNAVLILAAAGGLYAFWIFCRKVVKWGFFTLYFLMGAAITLALNPKGPAMLPILAGVMFAYTVMSIKSKIWKVVTPVVLISALALVVPAFIAKPTAEKAAKPKPKTETAKPKSR
jgi:hypothetical protein